MMGVFSLDRQCASTSSSWTSWFPSRPTHSAATKLRSCAGAWTLSNTTRTSRSPTSIFASRCCSGWSCRGDWGRDCSSAERLLQLARLFAARPWPLLVVIFRASGCSLSVSRTTAPHPSPSRGRRLLWNQSSVCVYYRRLLVVVVVVVVVAFSRRFPFFPLKIDSRWVVAHHTTGTNTHTQNIITRSPLHK